MLPAARICSWDSAVLSSSSPALHSCCCLDTADESAKCLCPRAPLNGFVRSHRTRGSAAGGLKELRRNLFWLQCTPYTSSNPHAWSTRSKSMGRSRVAPVSTASLMHWLHETGATMGRGTRTVACAHATVMCTRTVMGPGRQLARRTGNQQIRARGTVRVRPPRPRHKITRQIP